MDFYNVLKKRRSIREFQAKPVEKEKLLRVLDAGLKAPTHNHQREWEFILLKNIERRKEVLELEPSSHDFSGEEINEWTEGMTDQLEKEMYLKALPVQKRMLLSAPEVLIVCFRMRKSLENCKTLFDLNSFASVWCCIENILLAMAAEGLYGVTKIPYDTVDLKKALNIPEGYEIAAIIPIGYPHKHVIKQKPVSLQKKVHFERWGETKEA
ncbi:MAG: nitroreductase family protein [Promethearchaeota archaeon]